MTWWPFGTETRSDAIRSGNAIPNREERAVCWASRDAYFACLDANNLVDVTKEPGASAAKKACAAQSADFERDCAVAWVKYFKQWRIADVQKRRRLDELKKQGAVEMSVSTAFAPEGKGGASKDDLQDMWDKKSRK